MIFKRAVAKLRAQDWTAIVIELGIVILGVFIGTWVANWNATRLSERQTRQTLIQLLPELKQLNAFSTSARRYYSITDAYGQTALKGWAGDPAVTDAEFVIAAYQASQIYGFNNNGASWSLVFGADQLRNIDDPAIRRPLTRLMTFDYLTLNLSAVMTPYRDQVRQYIPDEIQGSIRQACGDRSDAVGLTTALAAHCPLRLDPTLARQAATELRAHPELGRLLGQHRATVSAFLSNLDLYDAQERQLETRVAALRADGA
jgi:hypothetical protein